MAIPALEYPGGPSEAPARSSGKKVLIVDDEARNLELLNAMLEPLGCEVIQATDGAAALELYARRSPDLVLLDLMMPIMNGFAVLEHLRPSRAVRPVPIIVVTAGGERPARLRAFDLGASEFLDKPVDRSILLKRVQTLLDLQDATDALKRRNAELEALQIHQRELTAFLVHDLKGPLSVISISASWLGESLPHQNPETTSALEDITEATHRLNAMVGDMLQLSRLEGCAAPPLAREQLVPAELTRELARELRRHARSRRVALVARAGADLKTFADIELVRRALMNLLENALRHVPEGGKIFLGAHREGPRVCFSVSNTGPPIRESERARIFERFVQSSHRSTRGSAGLGLSFCRRVAEVHGGTVELSSSARWPVCFTLTIPDHPADDVREG